MKKISINENLKIKKFFSLAIENYEKNNFKIAQNFFQNILKIDPYHAESCYNLGLLFQTLQEFNKAKNFYQRAIKIKNNYLDAHNNLGLIFRELDDLKNSKLSYEKAVKIDPNSLNANFNLGIVFRELGQFQKAIDCYLNVIKIKPNFVKAHNNIGNVFKKLGENHKALTHFKKALKLDPKSIDAQVNISNVYISQLDNLKNTVKASHKALKMYHEAAGFVNSSISLYRLKHDMQQAEYLDFKNYSIPGINEFMKTGNKILNRKDNLENNKNFNEKFLLSSDEMNSLYTFHKANYIYETADISDGCINPNNNWNNIEDEYFNNSKQIIYIDNFLSDHAIKELREFCLTSKIWIEERRNKYLGSFSDKGFISLVHLQIAAELKKKLPRLFGKHRLGRFWAFKYDTFLGKGINIHADFAAINLNFWITPDEFNNNKNAGGLKVYDIPAPESWTFKKYNKNAEEIYKHLKKKKARCTNIPYRFNRAVLFNSDYFHETDEIDFKDKYEGRRINVTYLFGDRLFKKKF